MAHHPPRGETQQLHSTILTSSPFAPPLRQRVGVSSSTSTPPRGRRFPGPRLRLSRTAPPPVGRPSCPARTQVTAGKEMIRSLILCIYTSLVVVLVVGPSTHSTIQATWLLLIAVGVWLYMYVESLLLLSFHQSRDMMLEPMVWWLLHLETLLTLHSSKKRCCCWWWWWLNLETLAFHSL